MPLERHKAFDTPLCSLIMAEIDFSLELGCNGGSPFNANLLLPIFELTLRSAWMGQAEVDNLSLTVEDCPSNRSS